MIVFLVRTGWKCILGVVVDFSSPVDLSRGVEGLTVLWGTGGLLGHI